MSSARAMLSPGREAPGEYLHELTKANLNQIPVLWLARNPIGKLFVESAYRLEKYWAPVPDLSVLRNERLVASTRGLIQGAPDLAIEVVSSETAYRLLAKIQAYLNHGSKAVWAVFPERRAIQIYNTSAQITILDESQMLEDHDVLTGFSTPVSAIFEGL
jgi:Uma2 family endonuclease